jgi:Fic family protein
MKKPRITGYYETLGSQQYFIPKALPPTEPKLHLGHGILNHYGKAMQMLGSLNEMMHRIPDKDRFLKAYIWKEAILTSEIEGIHTTLLELLSQPYGITSKNKDTQLVINYSHALEHAVNLIQKEGMPIVARVLKEAHAKLLAGEGDRATPGEFRKHQVKVGNLVPALANSVPRLIADLEKFINDDNSLPPLIKAGLAHVQFETIHPFQDGNGRIGRLLIVLMLVKDGLLAQPLLYPSYFFKKHHAEYYAKLDGVRTKGSFEGWIKYYLHAIAESAEDATKKAREIELYEKELLEKIHYSGLFTRSSAEAKEFLNFLFKNPVISTTELTEKLNITYNAAKKVIKKFESLNILSQHGEKQRNKIYKLFGYIDLLG